MSFIKKSQRPPDNLVMTGNPAVVAGKIAAAASVEAAAAHKLGAVGGAVAAKVADKKADVAVASGPAVACKMVVASVADKKGMAGLVVPAALLAVALGPAVACKMAAVAAFSTAQVAQSIGVVDQMTAAVALEKESAASQRYALR